MAAKLELCNIALAKLGDDAELSSLGLPYESYQARMCALHYGFALNVLLDEHDWQFSEVSAQLAETTNDRPDKWGYAYATPNNIMRVITVTKTALKIGSLTPDDVEWLYSGGKIYSNTGGAAAADGLTIVYRPDMTSTHDTNLSIYTPSFLDAFTTLLASMLAGSIIKGDVGVAASNSLRKQYKELVAEAWGKQLNAVGTTTKYRADVLDFRRVILGVEDIPTNL